MKKLKNLYLCTYLSLINENDTWKISIIHKITKISLKLASNKKMFFIIIKVYKKNVKILAKNNKISDLTNNILSFLILDLLTN